MTALPNGDTEHPPDNDEDVDPGWPWSFLLLVGAGGLYLILRVVQAVNDYILN
ncbi:MAG: hypothetical protein QGM48_01355 [Actinomycetota bacterium]|nr:hypothetical protein [Actinomycetota bacterium]MDK1095732.1 hypothetical protein [Actinomycetota bacterium]MDK1102121.1 hypothetical protein [Actinomycetota bacterium]